MDENKHGRIIRVFFLSILNEMSFVFDEPEGVVEQFSPVVERTRYNTAPTEEKVPFVVVGTGFKHCR